MSLLWRTFIDISSTKSANDGDIMVHGASCHWAANFQTSDHAASSKESNQFSIFPEFTLLKLPSKFFCSWPWQNRQRMLEAAGKALRFVTVHSRSNMVQPYTRFIQYLVHPDPPQQPRCSQAVTSGKKARPKGNQSSSELRIRSNKMSSEENRWNMLKKLISSWALQKSALEDRCDKSCSVKWVATQGSCMFSNAYSLPTISCSQSILPCDANDPHVRREPSSLVLLLKLCLETFD